MLPGPGRLPGLVGATINDAGVIAYYTSIIDFTNVATPLVYGVYIVKNSSPAKVIASGDSLFGAKVTLAGSLSIGSTGRFLSTSGQIAFGYSLDNGAQGIAVAAHRLLRDLG